MLADALCPVSVSVLLQSCKMRNAFSTDGCFAWLTFNAYACVDVSPATVACHRDGTRCDGRVNNRWQPTNNCHRNATDRS
jgi:hypothetical protein